MTNQEWLQQNNAKIEAIQEKLAHKVIAKGTIEITENGKHDVAGYSDANVNVPVPDLSATTATADDVLQGKQFYNAEGEFVEGAYEDSFQIYADTKGFPSLFSGYNAETIPYLSRLDTSNSTSMYRMFYNCNNLTSLNVSNFNTSNVTDMTYMFYGCNNLTSLNVSNFDTGNVTNTQSMFYNCKNLTSLDLSNFDTSKVTNMDSMFNGCNNLLSLDLSNFDTSNVTNMQSMFGGCNKLTSLDLSNFDTSNVTNMFYMFIGCQNLTTLDLSNFDTGNVTNTQSMFYNCDNLTLLDLSNFNTSKMTGMSTMFYGCDNLTSLDLSNWDTSNFAYFSEAFRGCKRLKNIIGTLDLLNSTNTKNLFYECSDLETVTLKNIKVNISMYSSKLTNETLINTAQELWDNTDNALGGSRKLTLSTTSKNNIANVYVKLIDVTDEMRAEDPYIDNKKPCVVCESTDEGAMTLTEYVISKGWAIA